MITTRICFIIFAILITGFNFECIPGSMYEELGLTPLEEVSYEKVPEGTLGKTILDEYGHCVEIKDLNTALKEMAQKKTMKMHNTTKKNWKSIDKIDKQIDKMIDKFTSMNDKKEKKKDDLDSMGERLKDTRKKLIKNPKSLTEIMYYSLETEIENMLKYGKDDLESHLDNLSNNTDVQKEEFEEWVLHPETKELLPLEAMLENINLKEIDEMDKLLGILHLIKDKMKEKREEIKGLEKEFKEDMGKNEDRRKDLENNGGKITEDGIKKPKEYKPNFDDKKDDKNNFVPPKKSKRLLVDEEKSEKDSEDEDIINPDEFFIDMNPTIEKIEKLKRELESLKELKNMIEDKKDSLESEDYSGFANQIEVNLDELLQTFMEFKEDKYIKPHLDSVIEFSTIIENKLTDGFNKYSELTKLYKELIELREQHEQMNEALEDVIDGEEIPDEIKDLIEDEENDGESNENKSTVTDNTDKARRLEETSDDEVTNSDSITNKADELKKTIDEKKIVFDTLLKEIKEIISEIQNNLDNIIEIVNLKESTEERKQLRKEEVEGLIAKIDEFETQRSEDYKGIKDEIEQLDPQDKEQRDKMIDSIKLLKIYDKQWDMLKKAKDLLNEWLTKIDSGEDVSEIMKIVKLKTNRKVEEFKLQIYQMVNNIEIAFLESEIGYEDEASNEETLAFFEQFDSLLSNVENFKEMLSDKESIEQCYMGDIKLTSGVLVALASGRASEIVQINTDNTVQSLDINQAAVDEVITPCLKVLYTSCMITKFTAEIKKQSGKMSEKMIRRSKACENTEQMYACILDPSKCSEELKQSLMIGLFKPFDSELENEDDPDNLGEEFLKDLSEKNRDFDDKDVGFEDREKEDIEDIEQILEDALERPEHNLDADDDLLEEMINIENGVIKVDVNSDLDKPVVEVVGRRILNTTNSTSNVEYNYNKDSKLDVAAISKESGYDEKEMQLMISGYGDIDSTSDEESDNNSSNNSSVIISISTILFLMIITFF